MHDIKDLRASALQMDTVIASTIENEKLCIINLMILTDARSLLLW